MRRAPKVRRHRPARKRDESAITLTDLRRSLAGGSGGAVRSPSRLGTQLHERAPLMTIELLGDCAAQIVLGDAPDEPTRRRIAAAADRVRAAGIPGVIECVPGFTTLTVHFDPLAASPDAALRHLLGDLDEAREDGGRSVDIPVCYGGEFGPDLEEVAALHGLAVDDVVDLHAAGEYIVHMIGFVPGFPYLGGLDPRLATPRRDTPRTSVPAGSVGIGGGQTGMYPIASPGGWRLIGRTPLRFFDAHRDPPSLLRAGDRVRFRPVDADEFRRLEGA